MHDQMNADLFPAVLRRTASLGWVVILPAFVLALVNTLSFWLVWGEMKSSAQHAYAATLLVSSLLPALAGLFAIPWSARKPAGLPVRVHLVVGLLCAAHLVAFCSLLDDVLPRETPDWVLGPSFVLIQFVCLMPGLFTGLWRIAGVRLNVRPLADFGLSALATFFPPALLYAAGVALSWLGRMTAWRWSDHLLRPFIIALMVAGPVVFFLGLLRCLMLARRFIVQKGARSRAFQLGYIGCVALILPIAGLSLNRWLPFPADFQNPWAYLLTLLNGAALMMPETGRPWADAVVRVLRRVLFPFTCYFFLVFLPFLPLSIVAILAMGTGFLILAPTLLFMVHGQIIKRDFEQEAVRAGRLAVWLRTTLCLLVLPLGFVARTEFDRIALHRTLDFRYAPDYREDARLSVPPALVRHVLLNVRRFKDGAELPYITNWYNWRVFDNLLLQDEKAEDLWRLIVGGEPPKPAKEDMMRNAFSSLFGGKTRSPERGLFRNARPMPRNVVLADVQTSCATTNGETETRVRLKVTSHDPAAQAEYLAKIKVPPGVWVSGFRLKIGDTWADGRVVERKAAEWVYRQIRDVSRRDPAILRYDDEETLTLRVFPVASNETREVEIAFLCPEGLADAVTVGERHVSLGDGTLKPVCAWADGVFVCNSAWQLPDGAYVETRTLGHLILDCSAGTEWTEETLSRCLNQAKAIGVPIQGVSLANYETRILELKRADVPDAVRLIRERMLPARGTLDAAGVLRRLARHYRSQNSESNVVPRIAWVGASARAALERVKAEQWEAFRHELPGVRDLVLMDEKGLLTKFSIPGAADGGKLMVALKSGSQVRLDSRRTHSQVVFAESVTPPTIWSKDRRAWCPIEGLAVMPMSSRWAKGAAAWRLQRASEECPALDHLRRDILKASRESGVLTTSGSYIVVENSMQWKMLEVKQRQTLAGDAALDLVESPAPSGWLLIALFALAVWAANRFNVLNLKRGM